MTKSKRIFISDIHLGLDTPYDWFKTKRHRKSVEAFLDYAADPGNNVKDVIFLGDLFENWLSPIDTIPPAISDIISYNNWFVTKVQQCLKTVNNVFYIVGNHDMLVTKADIAPFSIKLNGKVKHMNLIHKYNSGLLYAEHGSKFGMFNAIDKAHDPAHGIPLGYFISRLVAGRKDYTSPLNLIHYIDDILECTFTTQTIAQSIIEALMESSPEPLNLDSVVMMPQGRRDLTLEEVKNKYQNLFDNWVNQHNFRYAINAIGADGGSLNWFAKRICKRYDRKVVVFGHTHGPMLEKDRFFFGDGWCYVNSGNCCPDLTDKSARSTFVEVDKQPSGSLTITLKKYQNNKIMNAKKPVTVD